MCSLNSSELSEKTFLRHKIKKKYEMQCHHYPWHSDFIIKAGVFLNASAVEIVIEKANIHIFSKKCALGFAFKTKFFLNSALEDKKCNSEASCNFKSRGQIDSCILTKLKCLEHC